MNKHLINDTQYSKFTNGWRKITNNCMQSLEDTLKDEFRFSEGDEVAVKLTDDLFRYLVKQENHYAILVFETIKTSETQVELDSRLDDIAETLLTRFLAQTDNGISSAIKVKGLSNPPKVDKISIFGRKVTTVRYDEYNFFMKLSDLSEALGYLKPQACSDKIPESDKITTSNLIENGPRLLLESAQEDQKTGPLMSKWHRKNKERSQEDLLSHSLHHFSTKHKRMSHTKFIGFRGDVVLVSEKGMYEAMLNGKTEQCLQFRNFVTGTLLPGIRAGDSSLRTLDTVTGEHVFLIKKESKNMRNLLLDFFRSLVLPKNGGKDA